MKFRTFSIIFFIFLTIAGSNSIFSQKCKVRTSCTPDGCAVYTEVFEFDYVDEKPQFPGGGNGLLNYINSARKYPAEAYQNGIQGRVTCAFVVNPEGKVCHPKILRGVEESLNQEALRIVSEMPDWTPGKINQQAVPVRVVCYIPFRK